MVQSETLFAILQDIRCIPVFDARRKYKINFIKEENLQKRTLLD